MSLCRCVANPLMEKKKRISQSAEAESAAVVLAPAHIHTDLCLIQLFPTLGRLSMRDTCAFLTNYPTPACQVRPTSALLIKRKDNRVSCVVPFVRTLTHVTLL